MRGGVSRDLEYSRLPYNDDSPLWKSTDGANKFTQAPVNLTSLSNERAQPIVPQVESSPDKRGNISGKQNIAEQRLSDAQLARHRTPEIARQQDCPKNGRGWNRVDQNAKEQDDT